MSEVRQRRRSGTGGLRLAVGGFARLVVLAAFALIVGAAVIAPWQRGDDFMRRYFEVRAGTRPE